MGALMQIWFLAALCAHVCSAAPVSDTLEVLSSPALVHLGDTITLPCWLNPPQSAEGLEVRWYRPDRFDSPILFYQEKKFEEASQDVSYAGRVSFGLKDAASGGLSAGDVSLKLENATMKDAGDYTCYISSDQGYDSASVGLTVTATGTPPLLSAEWKEDTMIMSCESAGWYPEPSLRWSDQTQVLTPKGLKYSNDSSGLVSVHSWLLVSSSTEVSCSVGVSAEETKEARVRLENPPRHTEQVSGSSAGVWVAFAVVLVAALLGLLGVGVLYFKMRRKKAESRRNQAEENQKLLSAETIKPTSLSTASKYHVNVTLDKVENPYLIIKDSILRDAPCVFPDGQKVTCLTSIKATPGFSSGQHYWEVSLGKQTNIDLKQSWWIGVTNKPDPHNLSDLAPTVSNGFWFLSSSRDTADSFEFSTEPKVLLPVGSRPQKVGVYLNYDGGELSFYNVKEKRLIGSLATTFKGDVFPFFNPGKGDIAPMEILQRAEQDQSSVRGFSLGFILTGIIK